MGDAMLLRASRHGRVGVGLLMTIADIGAVLLGQLAAAASLAFLFSLTTGIATVAAPAVRRVPAHV